jgi:hypothetical protein
LVLLARVPRGEGPRPNVRLFPWAAPTRVVDMLDSLPQARGLEAPLCGQGRGDGGKGHNAARGGAGRGGQAMRLWAWWIDWTLRRASARLTRIPGLRQFMDSAPLVGLQPCPGAGCHAEAAVTGPVNPREDDLDLVVGFAVMCLCAAVTIAFWAFFHVHKP